jgi:murein tripeptide amidase MpaA
MKGFTAFLCLALVAISASAAKVSYKGYKVYRFTPTTEEHVQLLNQLESVGVKFWEGPAGVGKHSDVLFAPHQQTDLLEGAIASGIQYEEYISDVQSVMDEESKGIAEAITPGDIGWTNYYRLADIYDFLNKIAAASQYASVVTYGKSTEGRDLKLIKISKSGETRPAIFIEANIHAREWITNAVTTYIINELVSGSLQSRLDQFDFYIVPVTNPDGYEYTHTTDRAWRKTRSQNGLCRGADPNRNWDYQWMTGGSSNQPCSDTYAGRSAFSEPESRLLAEYYKTVANRVRFYFAVHSYSQLVLIPFGYTATRIPDYTRFKQVADQGAAALRAVNGVSFTSGNIVELLYAASGGSVDWVLGKYPSTRLVLAAELRDTGRYGFNLPANQIIPSALELIAALNVWLDHVRT